VLYQLSYFRIKSMFVFFAFAMQSYGFLTKLQNVLMIFSQYFFTLFLNTLTLRVKKDAFF
jgi:hypothetical protein